MCEPDHAKIMSCVTHKIPRPRKLWTASCGQLCRRGEFLSWESSAKLKEKKTDILGTYFTIRYKAIKACQE